MEEYRNGKQKGTTTSLFDNKGNFIAPYEIDKVIENSFVDMSDDLIKQESDGVENIKPKREIGERIVGALNPMYRQLLKDGVSEGQAKSILKKYLSGKYDKLDKTAKDKIKLTRINDIIDSLSNEDSNTPSNDPAPNLAVLNNTTPETDARQEVEKKLIESVKNEVYNQAYEKARTGGVQGIGYF